MMCIGSPLSTVLSSSLYVYAEEVLRDLNEL